jgi:hypothetical protein
MGRKTKRRGGISAAYDVVKERLRVAGVVRHRDFEPKLNTHNWLNVYSFSVSEAAPRLWVSDAKHVSITALASARFSTGVIGLESALFFSKLIKDEPLPVRIVLPRGARKSRFTEPPVEYHWSNVEDPHLIQVFFKGIFVRVYSPARALLDILRMRPPEQWPALPRTAVPEVELWELARTLQAEELVKRWLQGDAYFTRTSTKSSDTSASEAPAPELPPGRH